MNAKKLLFIYLCCTMQHSFGGLWWSRPQPDTQVTLPNADTLATELNKDPGITWINKERFITTFAERKMEPDKLPELIEQEFDRTWEDRKTKAIGIYTLTARKQFEDNKQNKKNVLLTILLKDHPNIATRLQENKA